MRCCIDTIGRCGRSGVAGAVKGDWPFYFERMAAMLKYQHYMIGQKLKPSRFEPTESKDHEHCVMCGAIFSSYDGDLRDGLVTLDGINWVCLKCYEYYKDEYGWSILR